MLNKKKISNNHDIFLKIGDLSTIIFYNILLGKQNNFFLSITSGSNIQYQAKISKIAS